MPRKKLIQMATALLLVAAFGIKGFFVRHPRLEGGTMGTSYSVTLTGYVSRSTLQKLQDRIGAELDEINAQMSTWDPASEISRFNHSDGNVPFPTSEAFAAVVQRALELSESTGGAFDPTLQPLLNLWGFGSEGEERTVPSDTAIATVKAETGWEKVWLDQDSRLRKTAPEISLALGAIAKGYGVDAIGKILDEAGFGNWFVEIGGEVVVKGVNPAQKPWRVGIQLPTTNPMAQGQLQGVVNLTHGAVATSGDYRNYIFENGTLYSHILDPRVGRAVLSDTASVTVVASSCMDADGIATALFVMGAADGLEWIEQTADAEAMFLVRGADGEIFEKFSSGFAAATGYVSTRKTL